MYEEILYCSSSRVFFVADTILLNIVNSHTNELNYLLVTPSPAYSNQPHFNHVWSHGAQLLDAKRVFSVKVASTESLYPQDSDQGLESWHWEPSSPISSIPVDGSLKRRRKICYRLWISCGRSWRTVYCKDRDLKFSSSSSTPPTTKIVTFSFDLRHYVIVVL